MSRAAVLSSRSFVPPVDGPESDEAVHNYVEERSASSAHDHDILTTAEGSSRLGVFVDCMRAAGLTSFLLGPGPFTVFAPTDRAFAKFSVRSLDALLADKPRLSEVMRGHVVAGRIIPPTAHEPVRATTIDGKPLLLTLHHETFRVGKARLVQTSIPASNGIIHAIDSILMSS